MVSGHLLVTAITLEQSRVIIMKSSDHHAKRSDKLEKSSCDDTGSSMRQHEDEYSLNYRNRFAIYENSFGHLGVWGILPELLSSSIIVALYIWAAHWFGLHGSLTVLRALFMCVGFICLCFNCILLYVHACCITIAWWGEPGEIESYLAD